MSEGQLADLLRYRIAEAHETLREAQVLLDADALRGATNRAYYAMVYAILALLATPTRSTPLLCAPWRAAPTCTSRRPTPSRWRAYIARLSRRSSAHT